MQIFVAMQLHVINEGMHSKTNHMKTQQSFKTQPGHSVGKKTPHREAKTQISHKCILIVYYYV